MCPSGRSLRPHHVSTAENLSFRPAFDVLDVDRDGKISRDDLYTFYSGFGRDITGGKDDVIGTMMTMADTNKNGFVEYDEFERVLLGNTQKRPLGSTVMEDVFRVMDKDGDGKLSHNDLKSYMSWAGFAATDEDINAMIKLGGGDQNGGVSFDGLLRILAVDNVVQV
ncbi:hypothetical protein L6164_013681 [Bauhinia variegata]|uniref:Uncharacterized protein n=1 Tax=Bauhinia variegata TaxID=167791 RepID=A0ACB9NG74_BAUVA|nr:hypothetical protein L6164_013681 [Bauhinia variegata]